MRCKPKKQEGQTLVTLLFFVVIAVTITTAAVVIIIVNSLSTMKLQEGTLAYYVAESGIENALLRLLRNPNYTGETLTVGSGTAVITVSGTNPKIATSSGTVGNFTRKIQVYMNENSGYFTFTNWKEVF